MVTAGCGDVTSELCSCIPVFEDEKVMVKRVHMVECRCRSTHSYLRH
jgi:hypothetical protein